MSVETLTEEVSSLKSEIERLHGIIRLMKRGKYGSKSERVEEIPPEQLIFNEIESEAVKPPMEDEAETITYKRKKGRGARKPFPVTWTPTLVPLAERHVLRQTRLKERSNEGEKVHGRTNYQSREAV